MRVRVLFIQEFYQIMGKHSIELELPDGATVRDVLMKLPKEILENVLNEDGTIKHPAEIAVNGRRIEFLDGLDTKLKDGDQVLVSPRALFVV